MTDSQRSLEPPDVETQRPSPGVQEQEFDPPTLTKLGTLTRVVKASGAGAVTIGAGVG